MRMYDIISNKKLGKELSKEEIKFFIEGYSKEKIPDYQASALLMAIYFKGMNKKEISYLTKCMVESGDKIDLSNINGVKVDKHSTGGVGDKTSLIIAPLVAYFGVPVAKMSGRGLGHTGGTIDKLESIPGFKTEISGERFIEIVNSVGVAIVGQSGNLAPADKKLYALRDVTATVDSIALISASIMSKKIASGADKIVLDVKTGSGALLKTLNQSIELAKTMVEIGKNCDRETVAIITDMDTPLGTMIGNSLEIQEAVQVLKGTAAEDLTCVSVELASIMLNLAGFDSFENCKIKVVELLKSGKAVSKFAEMVEAQGGDRKYIEDTNLFPKAKIIREIKSPKEGYIYKMDSEKCGISAMIAGAGRETEKDVIDYSAGIILKAKTGNYIKAGEVIAEIHSNSEEKAKLAEDFYLSGIDISEKEPKKIPLIYAYINKDGNVTKGGDSSCL